ncbi:hypothetical protein EJB05_35209, partial [Eragrostis curvula]
MPSLIGIGVPDGLPNGLKPNFTCWCASTSSTSYPKFVGRESLNPPGSASEQPSLPFLDLFSTNDGVIPLLYSRASRNAMPSSTVAAGWHQFLTVDLLFIRMDDDMKKRYENMKSKKIALSSKSPRPLTTTIKTG